MKLELNLPEIDSREFDGIRVTSYWDKTLDQIHIIVDDFANDTQLIHSGIPKSDYREAFDHPFAYKKTEAVTLVS